ncbi:hypothetical protein mRhiFer1_009818 [Rhinolophus ferrumequinum]|uniref:Uncharacterized protein n=1 Tax=Rhinolophus ferrumequinum TaxID=59479 RepID=A0A7J7YS78_RHIFE|nr:hypothetical protein mRhiFer1_009818 [Rhinolophus ferrumequinum]
MIPFPSWCFIFTGIDTSLDMDLPSSIVLLAKPSSMDLQNVLFSITEFHTALPLTNELILQQVKCGNGLMFIEFTGLGMLPIPLKQLSVLLRTQLICQQHLWGLKSCPPGLGISFESESNTWYCFSQS